MVCVANHLVLQGENRRFVDIDFDTDFRLAGTHKTIGPRWVQDTWNEQLLPEVRTLVQEDLEKTNIKNL